MTIDDLISELEQARDELGGHAEVRVAYQQNYPLRGTIARMTVPDVENPYDEGTAAPGQDGDAHMAWLAVGSAPYDENPYGPEWAWTGEYPAPEGCGGCGRALPDDYEYGLCRDCLPAGAR
jgi:hypothetical protein